MDFLHPVHPRTAAQACNWCLWRHSTRGKDPPEEIGREGGRVRVRVRGRGRRNDAALLSLFSYTCYTHTHKTRTQDLFIHEIGLGRALFRTEVAGDTCVRAWILTHKQKYTNAGAGMGGRARDLQRTLWGCPRRQSSCSASSWASGRAIRKQSLRWYVGGKNATALHAEVCIRGRRP